MSTPTSIVHPPTPSIRVILPGWNDPPVLITGIDGSLYHLLVLPREWQLQKMATFAYLHAELNGLDTYLVPDRGTALCFNRGDMQNLACGIAPVQAPLVTDRLVPGATMPATEEYLARAAAAREAVGEPPKRRTPDRWMGGGPASPAEIETLAGHGWDGVPTGLEACPECGEWFGFCLAGRAKEPALVQVRCACELPSCCALCKKPLHPRRLGTNYYDRELGKVVYVPGFPALDHRCG